MVDKTGAIGVNFYFLTIPANIESVAAYHIAFTENNGDAI